MATSTKSLFEGYMGALYEVTEKTARLFIFKVRKALAFFGNHPMDCTVHVDEFVLGVVDRGKVSRMYTMRIKHFSARALQYILINNIGRKAKMTTDKLKSYVLNCKGL